MLVYFVDDISRSFVINDILYLANRFDKILLLSTEKIENKDLLPKNVLLIENFIDWKRFSKSKILLEALPGILYNYILECWEAKKIIKLKSAITLLASNYFKANEAIRNISAHVDNKSDIRILYSFWFYDCTYLAFLTKKYNSAVACTRAHGGDLYEERDSIRNRVLMRNFQLRNIQAVFPISRFGKDYLSKKYPRYKDKIKTIFLGTREHEILNPPFTGEMVVVSVGTVQYLKNIHKIAEAMMLTTRPITWYHFGNENLQSEHETVLEYKRHKQVLMQSKHVNYHAMGYCANEELLQFYKENHVSLFLSYSKTEGIPVSMMEAISFGIPILSTDVGACKEIVTEESGQLIAAETDVKTLATILDGFINSALNTPEFRTKAREYWSKNFRASKNYEKLFQTLKTTDKS